MSELRPIQHMEENPLIERYMLDGGSDARDRIIQRFLPMLDVLPCGVWVAGGAIRAFVAGEPIVDIDLGVQTRELGQAVHAILTQRGAQLLSQSGASTKFRDEEWGVVDINTVVFVESPTLHISQFDFTITQALVERIGTGYLYAHADFFADVASKRLRLSAPTNPVDTFLRLQKYIQRGYTADKETLEAIAEQVMLRGESRLREGLGLNEAPSLDVAPF